MNREKGKIIRLTLSGGYGFIQDAENNERFFHATSFKPRGEFDNLEAGDEVTFEPAEGTRGKVAMKVEKFVG